MSSSIQPKLKMFTTVWTLALLTAAAGPTTALAAEKTADLPLRRVVMFNSGVAFYERGGQIEGDAKIDLKFNVRDVNDLLKSMVVEDLGGGRISAVTYGSKDPITRTLKTFAIDLTQNPTLANLLGQVRGERVEIDAPTPIVGIIVSVERRKQPAGEGQPIEVDYLNLLTDEGLRSVSLESVGRIKLTNEELDAELRQALTVLAMSHATDKKTVTLNFLGKGPRPVRVGYIQESPLWKTSYRLVLGDEGRPLLQGWAIVENTTEADWKNVQLTLVSGRPISFIMDLYQPLYIRRPVVEPELYASLRPPSYDQSLAGKDDEFRAGGMMGKSGRYRKKTYERLGRSVPADEADEGMLQNRAQLKMLDKKNEAAFRGTAYSVDAPMDASRGTLSVAQATDVGEMFQYQIDTPVTLQRQRSAMLPIVNEAVDGEKVSIYNPAVHAKHPLNGLRLTNSTELHLMQGPITVFDGGAYAGDARLPDVPPAGTRLVSYAMDLDTEVAATSKGRPQQLLSVKLIKGVLKTSHKHVRTHSYTIKNSGDKAKNVLVEYPLDTSWKLVSPETPAEKTRDLYRFAVTAEPGKPAKLKIEEERVPRQSVAVTNLPDSAIRIYLSAKVVSSQVKKALNEVIRRKAALERVARRRADYQQQIATIGKEQDRIRQNMSRLPRDSDLFRRYVQKFTTQEDKIEQLREKIAAGTAEETRLRRELDAYLTGLNLS